MSRALLAWIVLLWVSGSSIFGVAEDRSSQLAKRADLFLVGLIAGDADVLRGIFLPEATSFPAAGGELRGGFGMLGEDWQWEIRNVERRVQVHGETGVVTELNVGTAYLKDRPAARGPWRQTALWLWWGDAWKIAHLHTSEYARWRRAIEAFEREDERNPPKPGGIVFVGSSTIRDWKTLSSDFPSMGALGRGFGGSELIDSVLYAERIVTPYQPRAVVVYAGDNDIANGKSAERVLADFERLVATIHRRLPQTRIAFLAIKPSLSRWKVWTEMKRANLLVEGFAKKHELVDMIDVATPMIGADGKPRPDLFAKDGLHLNATGYALWASMVRSRLERR